MKNRFRAFYIGAAAVVGIGLFGTALEPFSHSIMGNPAIPVSLLAPQTSSFFQRLKTSTPGRQAAAVLARAEKHLER